MPVEAIRDGRTWRIGTAAEVAWIARGTTAGSTVTVAIPAVFDAYATIHPPEDESIAIQERALVQQLADRSGDQPWWLGFLDTGAHDVVFGNVPKVTLYTGWPYVLVEAGPTEALSWRTGHMRNRFGVLPDLFFPADRSWLVSALWDDEWTCIGGPAELIDALERDQHVQARPSGMAKPGWD